MKKIAYIENKRGQKMKQYTRRSFNSRLEALSPLLERILGGAMQPEKTLVDLFKMSPYFFLGDLKI